MKQMTIKSALLRIMAVALFMMVTVNASAQYYMNVVMKSGDTIQYAVSDVDSVFFSDEVCEYVDLGLSVKWATCNLGADNPEEYGNYYAWGETSTKSYYASSSYKWSKDFLTLSKYNFIQMFGGVDNKMTLDPEDDVVRVAMGGSWHMPTHEEQEELLNNCTWTWTTVNGVKGCRVTSNKPGYTDRSIFLPAAGRCADSGKEYEGRIGIYLSSSLSTDSPHHAFSMCFDDDEQSEEQTMAPRHYGFCIRPVCR